MPGKLKWEGGSLRVVVCHGMGGCNVSFAISFILSILHKGFCGSGQLCKVFGMDSGPKGHSWYK